MLMSGDVAAALQAGAKLPARVLPHELVVRSSTSALPRRARRPVR
jgi:hypothetical protein